MKTLKYAGILLLAVIGMSACSDEPAIDETPEDDNKLEYNDLEEIKLSRSEALVAKSGHDFAFHFLSEAVKWTIDKESTVDGVHNDDYVLDKNVVVSPFSMSSVLAMFANGAVGETQNDILKGLGYGGMSIADVNSYFNKMYTAFPSHDTSAEMQIANALFIQLAELDPKDIKQEFTSVLISDFLADTLHIAKGVNMAEFTNAWVREKTNNHIQELIPMPGHINPVKFAIDNAFYFDGAWTDEFDSKNTSDGTFTNLDGSKSKVKFMNKEYSTAVFYDDDCCGVNLRFGNGAYSVKFILPDDGMEITEFISSFDAKKYSSMQSEFANLKLSLPKFDVEFKDDYIEAIKACGFEKVFEAEADFSEIMDDLGSEAVGYLQQGCTFSIDEQGAKAASATQGGMIDISPGPTNGKMEITFDRPFMYVLMENTTNTILMTGVVNKL